MINKEFFRLGFLCSLILQSPLSSPLKAVSWNRVISFCVADRWGHYTQRPYWYSQKGRWDPHGWQISLTWLNCVVSCLVEFGKMALVFPWCWWPLSGMCDFFLKLENHKIILPTRLFLAGLKVRRMKLNA